MNPKPYSFLPFTYLPVWDRVSSCSSSWPQIQRSACLYLLGTEIKGTCPQTQSPNPFCSSRCYINLNHASSHHEIGSCACKGHQNFFLLLICLMLTHILAKETQQVKGKLFFISLHLGCSLFWSLFKFHSFIYILFAGEGHAMDIYEGQSTTCRS